MRQLTHNPINRSAAASRLRLLCLPAALAVFLLLAGTARADRFPTDPVEDLRQALKYDRTAPIQKEVLDFRRKILTKKIAPDALRTIGDMGRALLLQDWRDSVLEREIA